MQSGVRPLIAIAAIALLGASISAAGFDRWQGVPVVLAAGASDPMASAAIQADRQLAESSETVSNTFTITLQGTTTDANGNAYGAVTITGPKTTGYGDLPGAPPCPTSGLDLPFTISGLTANERAEVVELVEYVVPSGRVSASGYPKGPFYQTGGSFSDTLHIPGSNTWISNEIHATVRVQVFDATGGFLLNSSPQIGFGFDVFSNGCVTPTPTATPTNTSTSISTPTTTSTPTNSPTATMTPTPPPGSTPTNTPTSTPTNTPTTTPAQSTSTPTPTPTPVPPASGPPSTNRSAPKPSATPTTTPTLTTTPTRTTTPTETPTAVPTEVAGVVAQATSTATPTSTPTSTPTLVPTEVAGVVSEATPPPRPSVLPATGGADPYTAYALFVAMLALGLITLRVAASRR